MNKDKFSKWLDAILHEDGHNLSCGSVTTIRLIKEELKKPLDESSSSSPDDEFLQTQFPGKGGSDIHAPTEAQEREEILHTLKLPVGEPKQSEQDELWEEVVAQLVTFTKAGKMEAIKICEDLKKQFLLSKK